MIRWECLFHSWVIHIRYELVAVHLVFKGARCLLNIEVVHFYVLNLFDIQAHFRTLLRLFEFVLLVPVHDTIKLLALGAEAFVEYVFEFGVVWSLVKLIGEGLFKEWEKSESFRRLTEHPWSHLVLEFFYPLELGLVELGWCCLDLLW